MGTETPTEQQIAISARLYEMRDKARTLLGDKYRQHMEELGRILKMTAARQQKDVLSVAIDVCEKRDLLGIDLMMVMAAAVEIVEPRWEKQIPGADVVPFGWLGGGAP